MSENGEIYTAGKNFTLPPALTALTNSNSACFKGISQPLADCIFANFLPDRLGPGHSFQSSTLPYLTFLNVKKNNNK